jgi:hypothetical protein
MGHDHSAGRRHRRIGGPEQHSAGWHEFKLNSKIVQMDSNFALILINPKGAFACSKNWN